MEHGSRDSTSEDGLGEQRLSHNSPQIGACVDSMQSRRHFPSIQNEAFSSVYMQSSYKWPGINSRMGNVVNSRIVYQKFSLL